MITPMKRITVYGIKNDRKAVMELLQKTGCVEFIKNSDDEFEHIDVSDKIMQFERYLSATKQAIDILDEVSPEKTGLFAARKEISISKYSMESSEIKTVGDVAFEIIALKKKIHENMMNISRRNARILALQPWKQLDIPMNFSSLKDVKVELYSFPGELTVESMDSMLDECKDMVYYEIVSAAKDISCICIMYHKDNTDTVERTVREAGFVQPSIGLSHRTPPAKAENIQEKINALEKENLEIENKIKEYVSKRDDLKLLYDHLVLRIDKYNELSSLIQTDETFIIKGYVPENRSVKIKRILEHNTMSYAEVTDPGEDEEVPVLFKNNAMVEPVEGITETYAMPSKFDIDPNGVMAFFYYLFFGMMFSDAGYGLLMIIATTYFGFIAKVEKATKKTMRMFFYCGLSTFFWGLMYGSFFGDAIYKVSYTFFGKNITLAPIWLDPQKEPLTLLIFSIALGLIQILTGLIIKFYVDWRAGKKVDAVSDTGSWILILFGICLLAAGAGLKIAILSTVGKWVAILGVIIEVLMKGRESKNIIVRIMNGIIGLYDVTSFVSDALSYSRLMALGLATGVIAQVVNIMGALGGRSVVGGIMFTIIFIAGHLLNFAINALGAYVHTNRLQYVEFYSKFYEGGGKAFTPLTMNTNYYNFMEDEKL